MRGIMFLGFLISSMVLYFYTMKNIHKIVHGKDVEIDPTLVSHFLGGSVLVGVTMYLLLNAIA